MNRFIHLLRQRGHTRPALILVLLLSAVGTLLALASSKAPKTESPIDLAEYAVLMSNRIVSVDDLISWYYDQQDALSPLIPPGLDVLEQPGTPEVVVIDLNAKQLDPSFIKALLNTTPIYRNGVPTYDLSLQETFQGTIEIRDNANNLLYTSPQPLGYAIPYDALFRQSQNPSLYYLELARYRLKSKITLLPQTYVEPYLFAQQQIEEADLIQEENENGGSTAMLMSESAEDELRISGMARTTNGLLLELTYPESYSGLVWSAYSYDMQYCPITNITGSGGGSPPPPSTNEPPPCTNCIASDCDIDPTNTFMGLKNVWTLVSSNIVLTGTTTTVWLDTRPLGVDADGHPSHRFMSFGANTDYDSDGLSDGFELYVSKSQTDQIDSDNDGLPDKWEWDNGLDPNDAEGNNGADGDPDNDGLTNAEEWKLRANPFQNEPVIILGPDDLYEEGLFRLFGPSPGVQYRSVSTIRTKCGFPEFTNEQYPPSQPPRYFLKKTSSTDFDYEDSWPLFPESATGSQSDTVLYDPITCQTTNFCEGTASEYNFYVDGWLETEKNGGWTADCAFTGVWTSIHPSPYTCGPEPCEPYILAWADPFAEASWGLFVSWSELSHTWDMTSELSNQEQVYSYSTETEETQGSCTESISLSDEYTTTLLLNTALADLDRCDSLANIPWGEGRLWSSGCETNSSATAALRDLSTNETQVALTRIGYRFRVSGLQSNQIYRLNWLECFTPEGGGATVIQQARTAAFRGTGRIQAVEDSSYVIEPPPNDGTTEVVVFKVEIISVDATDDIGPTKINYKVTPSDISLPSATFTAPEMTETRANVSGNFFFTYNQSDLPEGDSTIRLSYLGSKTDLTATRTPTGKGPATELVIATIVEEENEQQVILPIPITHTLQAEGYDRITYSASVVSGSYFLRVGGAAVKVETGPGYEIHLLHEKHKYQDNNGTYLEQFMTEDTGPTFPQSSDTLKYFDSTDDRFFRQGFGLEGIARLDVIAFEGDAGPVFPIALTNEEVDQDLE